MVQSMIRVKNKQMQVEGDSAKSDYRRRNPEKAAAHRLVAKALAEGVLHRPHKCEGCNRSAQQITEQEGKAPEDRRRKRLELALGRTPGEALKELGLSIGMTVNARPMRGLVLSAEARHMIQYHHEDYARPFWVIALCPKCHKLIHKEGPDSLVLEFPQARLDARERACRMFALKEGVVLRGQTPIQCR